MSDEKKSGPSWVAVVLSVTLVCVIVGAPLYDAYYAEHPTVENEGEALAVVRSMDTKRDACFTKLRTNIGPFVVVDASLRAALAARMGTPIVLEYTEYRAGAVPGCSALADAGRVATGWRARTSNATVVGAG